MQVPAPIAVTLEIRPLDLGAGAPRVFRLSRAIGADAVLLVRPLPFEPGRRVSVAFPLPGEPGPITAVGRVLGVAPVDPRSHGEQSEARAIELTALSPPDRVRLQAYVESRTRDA